MTMQEIGKEVLRLQADMIECQQVRERLRTEAQYSRSVLIARHNFLHAQGVYRDFLASDLVTDAIAQARV